MAGRSDCCRYEPSLDELLDDEMMEPVLRSAGLDTAGVSRHDRRDRPPGGRAA